jgi:hypothetical protein
MFIFDTNFFQIFPNFQKKIQNYPNLKKKKFNFFNF